MKYLLTAIAIIAIQACSSTNKHKSTTETHKDSTDVMAAKKATVKRFDSTHFKSSNTINIKHGTRTETKTTVSKPVFVEVPADAIITPAADYFPVTYTSGGKKYVSVPETKTRQKTKEQSTDSTAGSQLETKAAKGSDSTGIDTAHNTKVVSDAATSESDKSKIHFSWFWLLVVCGIVALVIFRKDIWAGCKKLLKYIPV